LGERQLDKLSTDKSAEMDLRLLAGSPRGLLLQPGGFEGLRVVEVELDPNNLAIPDVEGADRRREKSFRGK
jgi:hypothetical protein